MSWHFPALGRKPQWFQGFTNAILYDILGTPDQSRSVRAVVLPLDAKMLCHLLPSERGY
jgi:hypothetical protein